MVKKDRQGIKERKRLTKREEKRGREKKKREADGGRDVERGKRRDGDIWGVGWREADRHRYKKR